jgi:hypothetical protein
MAVPFVRLGLGLADKLVDAHFDKVNNDLFTPGRRKKGLKKFLTPKQKQEVADAQAAGRSVPDSYLAGSSEDEEDQYRRPRGRRESRIERDGSGAARTHKHRSVRARSVDYHPGFDNRRSVDQYYHPDYDYTRDPQYQKPPVAPVQNVSPQYYGQQPYAQQPYAQQPYAQQPYVQEPQRTYEPPSMSPSRSRSRSRVRRTRPGLQKRSSSAGDVQQRPRYGHRDRKAGKRVNDKEGKFSLLAAGVLAAGAVAMRAV